MTARARLKVTAAAFITACDLYRDLTEPGQRLLGSEPGAVYCETLAGHRFTAYRLRCGGVEIREMTAA